MAELMSVLNAARDFWQVYGEVIEGMFKMLGIAGGLFGAWVWASRFEMIFKHANAAADAAHYSELDKYYADILSQGIALPYLRTPARVADAQALGGDYQPYPQSDADGTKTSQYDAYAYMVWNFLEAIHDRCAEKPSLKATWAPVIGAENALHRSWFLAQIRAEEVRARESIRSHSDYVPSDKFCVGFQVFVYRMEWQPRAGTYTAWSYDTCFKEPEDFRRTLKFDSVETRS